MAKKSLPFELRKPRGRKTYSARFRHPVTGKRVEPSTGTGDPERAEEEAWKIYKNALNGKAVTNKGSGPPVSTEKVSVQFMNGPMKLKSIGWQRTRACHYDTHIVPFFPSLLDVTPARCLEYYEKRFGEAQRPTVKKERISLRMLCRFAVRKGYLSTMPEIPDLPDGVQGTPYKVRRRAKADPVDPRETEAILANLDEWSGNPSKKKRFPVRARFVVQYDCALRPSVMDRLSVPEHWKPGSKWLELPASIMKSKHASRKLLSVRAKAALEACCRRPGLIFGEHGYSKHIKRAAKKVLGEYRGNRFCAQHFRSERITHFLDGGGRLTSAARLADHLHVSTTDVYARTSEKLLIEELRRQGGYPSVAGDIGDVSPAT